MLLPYIKVFTHSFSIIAALIFCGLSTSMAEPLKILVSTKPLHSLVSYITDGINQPKLLLNQQSPHDFQLRPSQKRLINSSDFFFYSDDNFESFVPTLKQSTRQLKFIEFSQLPNIQLLHVRLLDEHHGHNSTEFDGHLWLSINNAMIISTHITSVLSKASPEYQKIYSENLESLLLKLMILKDSNSRLLQSHENIPYLVYHDAFQYFEKENNLNAAYFITSNPEHAPGIKRIKQLRQLISNQNIQCVFYEPPNIPPLLNTLTEDKAVTLQPIDPLGLQIPMGKEHYFQLLEQTATTLNKCLKR